MKKADTKKIIDDKTTAKLSKLEALFNSKISLISQIDSGLMSDIQTALSAISNDSKDKQITVLITTGDHQNAAKKLWCYLQAFLRLRYLKYRITRIPDITMTSYGVYPHIENPFAIYQLNSAAETYANENILPGINTGLKNHALRVLKSLIRHHPSTAGIVISIYKKS